MQQQASRLREAEPSDEELLATARWLMEQPEVGRSTPGFVGFNRTKAGDRVLIASDTLNDPRVVAAIAAALRERGARVDVLNLDLGPDREIEEDDEIGAMITRGPMSG